MERHSNSTSIDKIQNYNDKDYLTVNKIIDEVFGKAINECFHDFSEITMPLLTRYHINEMIALYKSKLTNHYNQMRNMLGFDNKATKSRNQHLVETSYYDRLIFYQYLTQL